VFSSTYYHRTDGKATSARGLADHLRGCADFVARLIIPDLNEKLSNEHELRFGRRGSKRVCLKTGRWQDFEGDDHDHGDMLDLVRRHVGDNLNEAIEWAREYTNFRPSTKTNGHETNGHDHATNGHAQESSEQASEEEIEVDAEPEVTLDETGLVSVKDTPAEQYLRSRGITFIPREDAVAWRWYPPPRGEFVGEMVSQLRDLAGVLKTHHRIPLTADGRNPQKVKLFAAHRNVSGIVRFAGELPAIVTEGVEDAMTIHQATGREVWAVFGVRNFKRAPVRSGETIVIARDADEPNSQATKTLNKAIRVLEFRGAKVHVATPQVGYKDANDILTRHPSGADAVREFIDLARIFSPKIYVFRKSDARTNPRDYVIKGIYLKGNIYTLTGMKGVGKTAFMTFLVRLITTMPDLYGYKIRPNSRILVVGCENPDETKARLFRECSLLGVEELSRVVFMEGPSDLFINQEAMRMFKWDVAKHGEFDLVLIDSLQELDPSSDQNSRAQQIVYAKQLRETFTSLAGNPAVIVLAHPTKSPNMNSLEPAGGGSLANQFDGNQGLTENAGILTLAVHGNKWRGYREHPPLNFKIMVETNEGLVDSDGDPSDTVRVDFATEEDVNDAENRGLDEQERVVKVIEKKDEYQPGENVRLSQMDIAKLANILPDEKPSKRKRRVQYILDLLKESGLLEINTGRAELTKRGRHLAKKLPDLPLRTDIPNGTIHGVDEAKQADIDAEEKAQRKENLKRFS
jgi:AAA domain/Toprim domain